MTKRILAGAGALALAAALAIPAAGAAPHHKPHKAHNSKKSASASGPNFVDMNNDGVYTKRVDIVIKKLGGGIHVQDHGKVVTGSAVGNTFLVVANGHDLYLNHDVAGNNLVIVDRGGNIHVAAGVHIQASGATFGMGTRDLSGDKSAGSMDFGQGASLSHVYTGQSTRTVQIEAADLTVGAHVSISSMTQAQAKSKIASSTSTSNAYIEGTNSLSIDATATIEGLQIIGPNG